MSYLGDDIEDEAGEYEVLGEEVHKQEDEQVENEQGDLFAVENSLHKAAHLIWISRVNGDHVN